MIRAGFSWPTGQGRRAWISGPVWIFGLGFFGQGLWWLFVGWWLWAAWIGLVICGWAFWQIFLLAMSAGFLITAAWMNWRHGKRYRPRILHVPFGAILIDWYEI